MPWPRVWWTRKLRAWRGGYASGRAYSPRANTGRTAFWKKPALWNLLDSWLDSLNPEHFTEVLPLLRRTFSTFASPERRQMGELARRGGSSGGDPRHAERDENIDEARAKHLLPTLAALLGR